MKKIVWLLMILFTGCSNQVVLNQNSLQVNQKVTLKMNNGQSLSGTVAKVEDEAIIIRDDSQKSWRAKQSGISSVTGPEPRYDQFGKLISETDILKYKRSNNTTLFTLSGAVLSMGTSFFLSSMASRAGGDENHDAIIYGGTGAGTAAGAFMFYHLGKKKDLENAIYQVRLERGALNGNSVLEEKAKVNQLEEEIEQLKKQLKKN